MAQILSYFPGQTVVVFLETKDATGVRTDCASLPIVNRILFPGFTLADYLPQDMINLDTGLYYYEFTLPTGSTSIGNYLVDVSYINPVTSAVNTETYQIIVTAPYGNFSITTG
jgi:hypothetical protein